MLKLEVDTLDDIAEPARAFYEKSGEKFRLKVDGVEDTAALKRAKDHEKTARQDAEKRTRELQELLDAKEHETVVRSGKVEDLEKAWQKKHADIIGAKDAERLAVEADLHRLLVDNVAQSIAREIAVHGADPVILPHIKGRLAVDIRDGKRTTVVLDADGKASALTVEELKQEFVSNAAFAPVIAAGKGSGSGAGGVSGGGATNKRMTLANFNELKPVGRAEFMKSGGTLIQ